MHYSASTSSTTAQKVTVRKKSNRKGTSKRGADPSDIALALALSESMQMAGDIERQNQEEMLLKVKLFHKYCHRNLHIAYFRKIWLML